MTSTHTVTASGFLADWTGSPFYLAGCFGFRGFPFGQPPRRPFSRAAAALASLLALPPSLPRAWAALFIWVVPEGPAIGVEDVEPCETVVRNFIFEPFFSLFKRLERRCCGAQVVAPFGDDCDLNFVCGIRIAAVNGVDYFFHGGHNIPDRLGIDNEYFSENECDLIHTGEVKECRLCFPGESVGLN